MLTKKDKTIKYLVICVLVLCAHLIQNVGDLIITISGAKCFLIIPTLIILTIDEDEKISALFGLLAGFLCDSISANHFGFNAIFFALMCYASSAFVSYLL